MGVSTNGQICFGIAFDEDTTFPWDAFEGDITAWWIHGILGFKHSFEVFTPEGDCIEGISDKQISAYFREKHEFADKNPKLPVQLINYCSSESPMYILAIPETRKVAYRGYLEKFTPTELSVTNEQVQTLIEFCNRYELEYDGEPGWYLSSYWG